MAEPAEVVRIVIKTELDAASQRTAEASFDQTMNKMTASAGKAEAVVTGTAGQMGTALKSVDTSARQAGSGVSQMAQMLNAGKAPLASMAEQAVGMAGALAGGAGGAVAGAGKISILAAASRVASFFGGPWGIAMGIAGFALSAFLNRQKDEAATLDELYDKLVKQKEQSRLNKEVDDRWAATLDGLIEKLGKVNLELEKRVRTQRELGQVTLAQMQRDAAQANKELDRVLGDPKSSKEDKDRARAASQAASRAIYNEQLLQNRELAKSYSSLGGIVKALTDQQSIAFRQIGKNKPELATLNGPMVQMEAATTRMFEALGKTGPGQVRPTNDALQRLNDQVKHGTINAKQYVAEVNRLTRGLEALAEAAKKKTNRGGGADNDLQQFINPVGSGPVTGQFGERRAGRAPGYRHAGIDIAVPQGTPVKAAASGIIVESGTVPGYGNVIAIDHGQGTLTRYAHLSKLGAAKGTVVEQGQVIGASGGAKGSPGAGNSTGEHLHYEVRQGGKAVDPRTGTYRANAFDVNNRALAVQAKAEAEAARAAEERAQQQARFDAEMGQLDQQMVLYSSERATTMEAQLEQDLAAIDASTKRTNEEYRIAERMGRLAEGDAELLIGKNNQVATQRKAQIVADDQLRMAEMQRQIALEQQDHVVAEAAYQLSIAKTGEERLEANLRLLDAEHERERIALQAIIDATKDGEAQHEIAELRLAELDRMRNRREADARRDPANKSPIDQYRDSLNKTTGQIDEDIQRAVTGGLENLNDGLTDAIMGAKSLGEVFDDVADQIIRALVRIAIQQLIIKPLSDLLGGAMGGGGGGGYAGVAGSLFSGLFGGGKAGGGPVTAGKAYWVGENGPEPFFPAQNGHIMPNNEAAKLLGGGGHGENRPNVSLMINAPGATAETVAMIRRELAAAAPTLVAASQRATMAQLTRTRT